MTLIDAELLASLEPGGRAKKEPMANTLTAFDEAIADLTPISQTAAEWAADVSTVLTAGQIGRESDTGKFKFGDGSSLYGALSYSAGQGVISLGELEDVDLDGAGETSFLVRELGIYVPKSPVQVAALIGSVGFSSVVDGADYSGTPFQVAQEGAEFGQLRMFTGDFDSRVLFPAGAPASAYGMLDNRTGRVMTLECPNGVSINEVNEASIALLGHVFWWRSGVDAFTVRGAIAGPVLVDGPVSGQQGRKFNNLSGAQTLSRANFPAGAEIVHSGAAATYILPSRVATTGVTERLAIFNRGSGDITLSADGPTLQDAAATLIVAGRFAVLTWEHSGTTEWVWAAGAEEPV